MFRKKNKSICAFLLSVSMLVGVLIPGAAPVTPVYAMEMVESEETQISSIPEISPIAETKATEVTEGDNFTVRGTDISAEDVTKREAENEDNDSVEPISLSYAKWNTAYDLADKLAFPSEAGADTSAEFTVYKNGSQAVPIITTSGTSTSYYLGFKGLGTEENDYYQFNLTPEKKYGQYHIGFSMRGSNTGAKDWTLAYSTDNVTYITVSVFTISKASTYEEFGADIPAEANGSDKLYLRLTPGTTSIKNGTIGSGGTNYISNIDITAQPVISENVCRSVAISPESGVVAAGQELTLETATEGAAIYYSINGSDDNVYDPEKKPILTTDMLKDGAVISAYAVLEGKADSIKTTAAYTQAQVQTVKATPNGGAQTKGKQVILTCPTEDAVIQYSMDDGVTWTNYTGAIILETLPVSYQVKAVKDGYKDSAAVTLNFTERANEKYNIYFGQLHSHTSYSDGAGSCEEAFLHASNVENLDFLAVTDHSNSFDNESTASLADGSMSEEWKEGHALADAYTTDDFVSIYGYEMTWSNGLGHINTFNTPGFQSRTQSDYKNYSTALQNYYKKLKTQPDSISQFNHPGTTFGDFSDFAYYDEDIDRLITTIEVGNGEGAIGSSGYFPSYEYYQRALDKGWHVAPTNNQDNHKGLWGDANTARSVVLADSLAREDIYDAMRNYRVYATEDNDLNIYYTLDGYEMGSILDEGQTGDTVTLKAELNDPTDASIGKVQVIANGGLVLAEKNVTKNVETVEFPIKNDYSFYYIKITETDGDIAVTAPVWTGAVEAAGINSVTTDEVLPVKGEAIQVTLELYNNEPSDMKINSINFMEGDETVHSVNLTEAGLTSVSSQNTASYSFDFTYNDVGSVELYAIVEAALDGVQKVYKSPLKLNYVTPEMVTNVIIDGTHYNDYVTGYYGANVGNFTTIAGKKNIQVRVVKDEITQDMLDTCELLVISAPAKKTGTANAGAYSPSHFSDDFIQMVKNYTDKGGTLIACGTADYQDSTDGQTHTEMNKLLEGIGATTKINSDELWDDVNNGGQEYRLYLKNYNEKSKYLAGAVTDTLDEEGNVVTEGQKYSSYSGCSVQLNDEAVKSGKAEALVKGYDTTRSVDCKDENGNSVAGSPTYVEPGNVVALAHETLDSGANIFVAGTVFISDFEVKAELDNNWDLPYLNRTIAENILDEVSVKLPITKIADVRKNGKTGDVFAVEGYVTVGTSIKENTFFDTIYIQDETAGIDIFPYSESGLEIGTKIRITGYVDAYQGDKELKVISSEILDEAPYVFEPEKMSAKDAMDYEKSGGKLVQVQGKVVDVLYDKNGTGVSQFWLDDGSGKNANIFIDGYILSAVTGKNELASVVKKGVTVSAAGVVYAHPEGESDIPVTCLRVRNCDEIKAVNEDIDTKDITSAEIVLEKDSYVYNGTAHKPKVTVSLNGSVLTTNDYTADYSNNVNAGTAAVTVKGRNGYTGSITKNFTIEKAAKEITVKRSGIAKVYGNAAFALGVSVTGNESVTYSLSNKSVIQMRKNKAEIIGCGTVSITVKSQASANYEAAASKKITITVAPKKAVVKGIKSKKTGQMTISWKKDAKASGYKIIYSTNSKFKNAKTIKIASNKTTSKTIKKLSGGKKYYVKVRAYKKAAGRKIYGAYSARKTVTIKK